MISKEDAGCQHWRVDRGQHEGLGRGERKGRCGEESGEDKQAEEDARGDPELEAVLDGEHMVPAGDDGVVERDIFLAGKYQRTSNSHQSLSKRRRK